VRKALTHNLWWKFLSLAVAILLWTVFVRDPELSGTVNAPVLYRGMPEALELSGLLVDRVQLEVRGPRAQLGPGELSEAAVILELGNVDRPGDRTYPIGASNVSLPNGVVFSRAVPSQIRLQFERRIEREVPVRVRVSNPPPAGYRIASQTAEPDKLAVVGPQSHVEQIGFVDTDSIDLSMTQGLVEFKVNVFAPDAQVRFAGATQVVVRVAVEKIP
jgi:hypothetical protein